MSNPGKPSVHDACIEFARNAASPIERYLLLRLAHVVRHRELSVESMTTMMTTIGSVAAHYAITRLKTPTAQPAAVN